MSATGTAGVATSLGGPVRLALTPHSERPFVECGSDILSRGAFLAAVAARQAELERLQIGTGAAVYVTDRRSVLFWVDLIAVWGRGAIAVPIDANLSSAQA